MRNEAESIAVLQRILTKTHKQMMAGERTKGRVDMVVNAFNARSLKNRLPAFLQALGKRKVDVCVVNELSAAVPPTVRGYSWFLAKDDRPFRGTAIYVHSKLVTKVPDVDKEMEMKLIYLRVSTLPTVHIIGAYLDSKPTVGHAAHLQARLEEKIEEINAF